MYGHRPALEKTDDSPRRRGENGVRIHTAEAQRSFSCSFPLRVFRVSAVNPGVLSVSANADVNPDALVEKAGYVAPGRIEAPGLRAVWSGHIAI